MLVFDFDGVLIDSAKETAVVSYNVLRNEKVEKIEELPADFLALYELNRPRGKTAADMVVLARWCLQNPNKLTQLSTEEFINIAKQDPDSKEVRRDTFFQERKRLISIHEENWVKLSPTFSPVWNAVREMPAEEVFLVTHKNLEATLLICHTNGISVSADNVYSGDSGASKTDNFISLSKRFPSTKFSFIDDSLRNLLELKNNFSDSEMELLFPTWGYAGPGDEEIAREQGIKIVNQEMLIREYIAN